MSSFTPMMRQYLAVKAEHQDAILFFRLGDFYEMFFADAELAARELEITLTARDAGQGRRVPMCGVPHHAAEGYVARLIARGHKVAVCEQVEDPADARSLVERRVVRVITPGTYTDEHGLQPGRNNYLAAVAGDEGGYGLAVADLSTGEFAVTEFTGEPALARLLDELARLAPSECLPEPALAGKGPLAAFLTGQGIAVTVLAEGCFAREPAYSTLTGHFGTHSLRGFGCEDLPRAIRAAGALLAYVMDTQQAQLSHLDAIRTYSPSDAMVIDLPTRRSLEITERILGGGEAGTLLGVVDRTRTPMGRRCLRRWVERPLVEAAAINGRLDAVETLAGDQFLRSDLQGLLKEIYDLERLAGRVGNGTAAPRDLVALRKSLAQVPRLAALLAALPADAGVLRGLASDLDPVPEAVALLAAALVDEPPVSVSDGGVIRSGYHPEIDRLRAAARDGKDWVARLEAAERERTGIKSLRVGFNKVFGYFLEITNANRDLVPGHYIRKQTLVNSERYITPELKEREEIILGAADRLKVLEAEVFAAVRDQVASWTPRIRRTAGAIAQLDALASLAETALANNYVRPRVDNGHRILIKEGRHPVVEVLLEEPFVPNDALLDGEDQQLLLITGPNMAGKSTYLRQVALTVLMAQMGSFVPAQEAEIGIVDRIFARVGAADDLATGQSTFMVEMNEVANILHNATPRSLLILDEIGRGTSTFDGLSIAWAVAEYIHDHPALGCRTLFATHYHELTRLEEFLPGIKNYSVAVAEQGEEIAFLRRIVRGGTDRSYGIQVARLAGLPGPVINRARQILASLEPEREADGSGNPGSAGQDAIGGDGRQTPTQMAFIAVEPHPVLEELKTLNVLNMTPLEALNKLHQLQRKARKES